MLRKIFIVTAIAILSPRAARAADDSFATVGGKAEINFARAWKTVDEALAFCLEAADSCRWTEEEKDAGENIIDKFLQRGAARIARLPAGKSFVVDMATGEIVVSKDALYANGGNEPAAFSVIQALAIEALAVKFGQSPAAAAKLAAKIAAAIRYKATTDTGHLRSTAYQITAVSSNRGLFGIFADIDGQRFDVSRAAKFALKQKIMDTRNATLKVLSVGLSERKMVIDVGIGENGHVVVQVALRNNSGLEPVEPVEDSASVYTGW